MKTEMHLVDYTFSVLNPC